MKIRTILITTVVAAGITGGIGYGAYRAMKGQVKPVDVVPVLNVNQMYYGDEGSLYGTVTSQVAQTVTLNDEYEIEEIFVKPGDTVKEGTPLFSYDMTLPELELEMDKLTLQMYGLDKTRLQKELDELRGTRATASLEINDSTMTASGEGSPEEEIIAEPESAGEKPSGKEKDGTKEKESEETKDPGLSILDVETVEDPSKDKDASELLDGKNVGKNGETAGAGEETAEGKTPQSEKKDSAAGLTEPEVVGKFLDLAGQLGKIYGIDEQGKAAPGVDITEEAYAELLSSALYYRDVMADYQGDGTYKLKSRFQKNLIDAWNQSGVSQSADSGEQDTPDEEKYEGELQKIYDGIGTVGICHVEYAGTLAENLSGMDTDDETYETKVRAARKACSSLNSFQKELDMMAEPLQVLEEAEGKLREQQMKDEMETLILQFENLILNLDTLYREHADSISSGDIAEPVSQALSSFWSKLAQADAGNSRGYVWKEEVAACFENDREVLDGLSHYADKLLGTPAENGEAVKGYQTRYAELLLREWNPQQADAKEKAEQLLRVYDQLLSHQKGLLAQYEEKLQAARELAGSQETEPGSETGTESESGGESETGTESESGSEAESETGTESESGSEAESETGTESESGSEAESETGTESESESEMESESADMTEVPDETEPQMDDADIGTYINQFRTLAASTEDAETYLEDWNNAISIFQQKLGELPESFVGEEINTMDQYRLKSSIAEDESLSPEGLEEEYKELCLKYVTARILLIDTTLLDPTNAEDYDAACAAYEEALDAFAELGETWSQEITVSYVLDACDTILQINAIDESQDEFAVISAIEMAWASYDALPEEGKMLVWNLPLLEELMEKYGVYPESEPETEPWTEFFDPGWNDYWGGDSGYTAEELQTMIEDLESEIKECDLEIRETELKVKQQQRVVDGKVVKSTLNGTVLSIGSEDGSSDDEYFARVASTQGLYAIGSMNELSLEKIKVGDVISGRLDETGVSFTGTIKEIAQYPSAGESYSFGWGNENTNASYYEFKALLNDDSELSEGSAEIQLSETVEDYSNEIYLENFFVRTESDGRTYVMKQGEDGLLTKQYVETGRTIYGYATEIVQGVTMQDKLAFPYGNNVVEGAKTREVDQLDYS